jgi:hypothetical protein
VEAQSKGILDPTRNLRTHLLQEKLHVPLDDRYIGFPGAGSDDSLQTPTFFRVHFTVNAAGPSRLFLFGSGVATVFINGKLVQEFRGPHDHSRFRKPVFQREIGEFVVTGNNLLAIRIVDGALIVCKIVQKQNGKTVNLLKTSSTWKASQSEAGGWEQAAFRDEGWSRAAEAGKVEDAEYLGWNLRNGMYEWPGFEGISPYLAHQNQRAVKVEISPENRTSFRNADLLTRRLGIKLSRQKGGSEFTVLFGNDTRQRPAMLLDFGKELDGRLQFDSDAEDPVELEVQFGESKEETLNSPMFGGAYRVVVPPRGTAYSPKTGLRYALVRFLSGPRVAKFRQIQLDSIYYPVQYQGNFHSSDPVLDAVWETSAYTAHLTMQDRIWDGVKRDRGTWMGDLDVSERTIRAAFPDKFLLRATLGVLAEQTGMPAQHDINNIPGYTAAWITTLADLYRYEGDSEYLESQHSRLVSVLDFLASKIGDDGLFHGDSRSWMFVDWSPGLGPAPGRRTAEAEQTTHLEFCRAFREGVWLLTQLGDKTEAEKNQKRYERMREAARTSLVDRGEFRFGPTYQLNAMAILGGVADLSERAELWRSIFSQRPRAVITPYFGYYALAAIAETGHREYALEWIREYWGGMLKQGATTFWESYDPSWPKEDFHAHLGVDVGYETSLCHGWSAGPAAWLEDEILGVKPLTPGFKTAQLRPDLAGLSMISGAVPTPLGAITEKLMQTASGYRGVFILPRGVSADLMMPIPGETAKVTVNDKKAGGALVEEGTRFLIHIEGPGSYRVNAYH